MIKFHALILPEYLRAASGSAASAGILIKQNLTGRIIHQ